ncbi:MAG TPA: acyl-CoA dehydrogenase family protein [Tepidisphaeraceae bacterium]|jgi:alkylation response protein AidB-like acyl-CoA dehydrogenase
MSDHLLARIDALLPCIRGRADDLDQTGEWPSEDLAELGRADILGMALPQRCGGSGSSALDQHLAYEAIARGSLAVSLILSQRDAAIGFIEASNGAARDALLEELAAGTFTTVGIAQLTTSRQGGPPALRAARDGAGYRIDGLIPWCTGAAQAAFVVAGAATDDGQHLLFALRPQAPGVAVDPPMPLVALRSAWTASIHCEGVRIGPADVITGPAPKVLARANHLPLGQAYLAMGLCQAALDLIAAHRSPAAQAAAESFESQIGDLRERLLALSQPEREADAAEASPEIRGRCNDLAVRITHAAVALYKGTALLAGHPAQRLAREAMFLLVWSCPNPVIDCTVELLSAEC